MTNQATGDRKVILKLSDMVLEELKKDKVIEHLRKENLRLKLEMNIIANHPNGKAAKKIIEKYRKLMKARNERYVAIQN